MLPSGKALPKCSGMMLHGCRKLSRKKPRSKRGFSSSGLPADYRLMVDPDPVGPMVDPLGELLISELPDGFAVAPAVPAVPAAAPPPIPVVVGVLPAGVLVVDDPLRPGAPG